MQKNSILGMFLITSVLLFTGGCGSHKHEKKKELEKPVSFEEREHLKAKDYKIKKRTATSYFYTNEGKLQKKGTKVEEVIYYENGDKKELTRFASTGDIDLKWTYKYDSDGNIVSAKTENNNGEVFYQRDSKYEDGLEVERYELELGQKKEVNIKYDYDDFGNIIEETAKDMNGDLFSRIEFEYKKNVLIKSSFYDSKGSLSKMTINSYDSTGNKIREIITYPTTTVDTVKYIYDNRKNIVVFDQGYFAQKYFFDEKDNMLSEEWYVKGRGKQGTFKFIYNDKGLVVERIRYDSFDEPVIYTKYEYEFFK